MHIQRRKPRISNGKKFSECISLITMGDRTAERFSVEENTTLLRREIEASRFCNARDHALLPRDLQPSEDRDPTLDFDQDPDFLPEEDIGREDNLVQVGSHQQDRGKESNIRTFPMQSEITDLGLRPEGGLVRQRHSTEKIKHNGNEAETEEKKDDGSHFKPDDHFRLFRNDDEGKSNEVTDEIAETAGDFVQNIRGDVDVRMDSHDEAHLQHLAALVPGLCLTGSLHNRYTAVDGDDCVPEDSTSSAADEIASNVEPPLTHKRYSIYEKMTQARKLLKSEPNEVDEEGCNVSRKSTDTVARLSLVDDSDSSLRVTRVKRDAASVITMDDNSGIPEAEGPRSSLPGAAQNETNPKGWNHDDSIKASLNAVELADEDTEGYKSAKSVSNVKVQNEENSKGGKNANSAAASPDVVDLIGDMQDANSYAAAIPTEMYVLSLEGRDKKVKVQRAPPMNSSKPANGHLKNHTADAPDIFDLVTHEEEFVESEEAQAPSTGAAQVIIDLLSFDDLSMEGQALIQTIVEDKHATEEPDIFEETDEEDSHSEFETLKQAKEDPEDAGETDAETGDETAEEESANGIETNKVATGDHEAAEDTDEDTDKEKSTVIVATKKKAAEEPATDNKATEEPEVVNETNEKWRPPKSRQIAKREARYQRKKTARRHMAVIKTMQKIRIATTTQRVTMTKIQTATSLI